MKHDAMESVRPLIHATDSESRGSRPKRDMAKAAGQKFDPHFRASRKISRQLIK